MMATAAWDSIIWPKCGLSKWALPGLYCLDEEDDGTGPWDSNANFQVKNGWWREPTPSPRIEKKKAIARALLGLYFNRSDITHPLP